MKRPARQMGELALIESIRRASEARPGGRVRLGIGDDCAILRPRAGHEVLITTDFCLEGRHFRRDWQTPESAGHRCLARGLSDLAAMGAEPLAAFLSLALPAGTPRSWTDGFFRGLRRLADEFSVPLAGGDTSQSPSEHIIADIFLLGSAPAGKALRRSTARAGDLLYVTGSLGGAAAELQTLASSRSKATSPGHAGEHPSVFPSPRLAAGAALLRLRLATACIDISDGLSTDLKHLCDASGLSAEVEAGLLPLHPLATGSLELALHGGEDYELLFAAKPSKRVPKRLGGFAVTRIGLLLPRTSPVIALVDPQGRRTTLRAGGWEHKIG